MDTESPPAVTARDSSSSTPDAAGAQGPGGRSGEASRGAAPRPAQLTWRTIVAVATISVVLVVGGAYALTGGFHKAAAQPLVLVPAHEWYSLPGEQFAAVAFVAGGASVLNGTFTNTEGVTLYLMTPAELLNLSKKGVVEGYEWTSGWISNNTVTTLDLAVAAGHWDFVWLNPDSPIEWNPGLTTTVIGFYTDFTLSPG